jgi:hypothetical protein
VSAQPLAAERPVKSKKKLCHFGVVSFEDLALRFPET